VHARAACCVGAVVARWDAQWGVDATRGTAARGGLPSWRGEDHQSKATNVGLSQRVSTIGKTE